MTERSYPGYILQEPANEDVSKDTFSYMFKQYCAVCMCIDAKEHIFQDAIQIWTYEFLEEGYECEQKKISKTQRSVTETEAELLVCELLVLFSLLSHEYNSSV